MNGEIHLYQNYMENRNYESTHSSLVVSDNDNVTHRVIFENHQKFEHFFNSLEDYKQINR